MRMHMTEDPGVYRDAMMLTPSEPVLAGLTREQAFVTEGACVKSQERDEPHGFPKHHGRLVRLWDNGREGVVVVRSHQDGITEPRRVWAGTIADYRADWEVD